MAFPTSIPSNTDPTAGNTQNSPSHSQLHQSHNAEIVAIETKIGTGASTPAANKILYATGSGTSAWQGLTSAQLAALLSDETGTGADVFGTSPSITTPSIITSINDSNGNEVIKTPASALATNEITVTNSANGSAPLISATGSSDANVNLNLQPKGSTGIIQILDGNGNEVVKAGVATASAVNEITVTNAATANNPSIAATGNDSIISINLVPKSTGNVKKGGNNIDWWEEMGRTTNSAQASISVSFTAKKYLRFIAYWHPSGANASIVTFNSDSSANYARRDSTNGAADGSAGSLTSVIQTSAGGTPTSLEFIVSNNNATDEKIVTGWSTEQGTAGAANAPTRREHVGKWANTVSQISSITITIAAGNMGAAELVVLGHD